MSSVELACFITAITSFCIGFFAYFTGRDLSSKFWGFLCLSITLWSFGLGKKFGAPDMQTALFWGRFHYFGAVFIPALYFHFVLTLTKKTDRKFIYPIAAGYILTSLLFISNFTNLLVSTVVRKMGTYFIIPGLLYPVFALFFFGYIAVAHYILIQSFRTSSGLARMQLGYLLASSIVGYAGGFTAFMPIFFNSFPYGL